MALRLALPALLMLLVLSGASAHAAWHEPVGGDSPVNQAPDQEGVAPSLAAIGGVPFVAWQEYDGANYEIRVARLADTGTGWEQVVGGASPVNHDSSRDAHQPSLAAIGGTPYVAWRERDEKNFEIRVARLNAAGSAWDELVGGASPINHDPDKGASQPSLTAVDGVLYVAWREGDAVRVSRLNDAGSAWEELGAVNHDANAEAADPSLATIDDKLYVGWAEKDGTNAEIRVSRLNNAGTSLQEVVGGASPINHDESRDAAHPSLTGVGGAPHVAWSENDDSGKQIRAAKLNGASSDWDELVGGASPINHAANAAGTAPRLDSSDGVPIVSWIEFGDGKQKVRASRLGEDGSAWHELVGGANPINHDADQDAFEPTVAAVGGVPYVAWREGDGTNSEVRVSRLEPEFSNSTAIPTETGASLLTEAHTYGIAFPVGFEYGNGFSSGTPTRATSGEVDTVVHEVTGLTPSTTYSARPFATAGVPRPRITGAAFGFTTDDAAGPAELVIALTAHRLRRPVGKRVRAQFVISAPARLVLEVRKRRGGKRIFRKKGRAGDAGEGTIKWNGHRRRGRLPKPGRYRLVLKAKGADGQSAKDKIPLRLKRPRR